jgi:hypothetical protein
MERQNPSGSSERSMKEHGMQFLKDERGSLLVSDFAILATILVLAVMPSIYGIRKAANDLDLGKANDHISVRVLKSAK